MGFMSQQVTDDQINPSRVSAFSWICEGDLDPAQVPHSGAFTAERKPLRLENVPTITRAGLAPAVSTLNADNPRFILFYFFIYFFWLMEFACAFYFTARRHERSFCRNPSAFVANEQKRVS